MSPDAFETTLLSVALPGDKTAPALARRLLTERLEDRLLDAELGTVRLLATELVANAVLHVNEAADHVRLQLDLSPSLLRVRVYDRGAGFEKHQPVPRGATGGYGLFLVDRMATRWGVDREAENCVWFELERGTAA